MIRPAEPRDIPAIIGLINELAEYEKLSHECIADPALLADSLFGEERVARSIVAEVDEVIVGFALYFYNYSTFLTRPGIYLEDLYVKPEFRGAGIGKALLKVLAHECLAKGYGRLEWSVLDWNEPSIGFYKSIGAAPMDDWTVFRLTGEQLVQFGSE